jgi:nucleoside-diphosphate-sugar epimerase
MTDSWFGVVGCGYLGERLARRWLEQGRLVFATTRRRERADALRALGIEPYLCDVLEPESLRSLPTAEVLVHCVGLDRRTGRTMREIYVDGLGTFLQCAPPARRLIYVSSTSVYGQADGEEVDETAATEPADPAGCTVRAAEELLRRLRPDAVVLRFAGIYGPGRLLREQTIREGGPIVGDPDRWLNLIHVEDGVNVVCAAGDRAPAGSTFNVSDGQPVRRREFFDHLARLLGAPPPRYEPIGTTGPAGQHDRAHRRIANHKLRDELGVTLTFPDYRAGLAASLSY